MYEIILDEKDYLNYQLYTASKSKRIKNSRLRGWIISVLTCVLLSFLVKEKDFLFNYFLSLAVISLIVFPFYTRWRYKKYYLKFIRENYKNNFGARSLIEFTQGQIIIKDKAGEAKINVSEIKEVNEIADQIFIKFKSPAALIIPKKTINVEPFKKDLENHISESNIKWNEELTWRWK